MCDNGNDGFVESVNGGHVGVVVSSRFGANLALLLGAALPVSGSGKVEFSCSSERDLAFKLGLLRKAGFPVARGSEGTSPAAVFEDVRLRGRLRGDPWKSPGPWHRQNEPAM
jgi:hypothetical protein